jgi:hypothetical protein
MLAGRFFAPILKGAAATVGGMVDRNRELVTLPATRPAVSTFLIHCYLLYRRGQGESNRLCVPDRGDIGRRIVQECHDTPFGGNFGYHNITALVQRLVCWSRQTRVHSILRHVLAHQGGARGTA